MKPSLPTTRPDIRLYGQVDASMLGEFLRQQNKLAEIESGQRLELDGFAEFVKGSAISVADLQDRVCERDWYLPAPEALRLGLVEGLVS